MTAKKNLSLKTSLYQLNESLQKLRGYSFVGFLVFIALLYGFVLLRVNTLSNIVPPNTAINTSAKDTNVPRIDESVVKQLKSLQDNSVSVKTLFDEARNNPF